MFIVQATGPQVSSGKCRGANEPGADSEEFPDLEIDVDQPEELAGVGVDQEEMF